jgi:hypothetical protein
MKTLSTLVFLSLFGLLACKDCDQCPEPNYEYDPSDPKYICKAPEFAKNIVGSWKFESLLGKDTLHYGYVTFDALKRMVDPDSLVQNYIDFTNIGEPTFTRPVIAKEYQVTDNQLDINLYYNHPRDGKKFGMGWRLEVTENGCNRIKLVNRLSREMYVILTR